MRRPAAFNQGKFPTISFVNKATVPLGFDLEKVVAALKRQLDEHFVPIWGYPATLSITQEPKADHWQMVFLNDSDEANALGYHDLTKDGQPISKVFVKSTTAAGEKVSVTTSHELLEMLIDPGAQLWAQDDKGTFYAYEMCDAVEGGEYKIDGVSVSNFVYPSFFESWHKPRSVPFDYLGKVARPFQTLEDGYQIVSNGSSVKEVFGSRKKETHFRNEENRTMHRSEYRKGRMVHAASAARPAAHAGANMPASHAAVLYHAGKMLIGASEMVDPVPGGFELARRRHPVPDVVDPLPGGDPFEL